MKPDLIMVHVRLIIGTDERFIIAASVGDRTSARVWDPSHRARICGVVVVNGWSDKFPRDDDKIIRCGVLLGG